MIYHGGWTQINHKFTRNDRNFQNYDTKILVVFFALFSLKLGFLSYLWSIDRVSEVF